MQERLVRERSTGLNRTGIRTWGMVFLILASAGRALLQNRLLKAGTGMELLAVLNSEGGMLIATVALIMQAIESCAAPIFSFLLVEGVAHTSDFQKYLTRVAGLAVLTELPYNFAMSGRLLDVSTRNPVFAMLLALVLIYFYRRYQEKSLKNSLIKLAVTAAAVVWAKMLGIVHGEACVVMVAALWAFRSKPTYRILVGCAATGVCCLFSPFYLGAPMGFLVIHFYNGEKGSSSRAADYLTYPVALLAIGIIGLFL